MNSTGRTPVTLHRSRIAVAAVFLLQGMLLAAILTELPAIRAELHATDGLLAVIIGVVSVLSALGSVAAEKLAEFKDFSTALITGLGVLVCGGLAVAISPNIATFIAAVALYGIGVGMVDAAVNMQAATVQRRVGTVILSSFFASWSAGAILGAVAVSIGEGMGASYKVTIAVVALVVALVGTLASRYFLRCGHQPHLDLDPIPVLLPWRPVVALGLAMALFYAVDFGLSNWSLIFLHDALLASTSTAALGVAAYQVAGFFSRVTADFWTRRFGAVRVVLAGGLIATAGMLLTITAQSIPVALTGLGITGLGASVIAPLCFSAATELSTERSLDVIIARLNLFNYAGTILGGVVIGSVMALTDARIALGIPLLACIGLMVLSGSFRGGVGKTAPKLGLKRTTLPPLGLQNGHNPR